MSSPRLPPSSPAASIGHAAGARPLDLASVARDWAHRQDFSSEAMTDARIPRDAVPRLPSNVKKAVALYATWEQTDLGSSRLFGLELEGRRVWALHTTTDGDDGFLELYDGQGRVLGTGLTGVETKDDGSYAPTLTWDKKDFEVRANVTPWVGEPDVKAFRSALKKARRKDSELGARVTTREMRNAGKALAGPALNVNSVDRFETGFLRATLADAKLDLTRGATHFGTELADLYTQPFADTTVKQTSYTRLSHLTQIHEPWSRSTHVVFAERSGSPQLRIEDVRALTEEAWKVLPSELLPVTVTAAREALEAHGADADEAKRSLASVLPEDGEVYLGKTFRLADWVPETVGRLIVAMNRAGDRLSLLHLSKIIDD